MEKSLNFPSKGSNNNSSSKLNFIQRKDGKRSTIESRNKYSQKNKFSSNSSLINLKNRKEKDLNSLSSINRSLLLMEELEEKKINKTSKKNKEKKEKRYIVDNMEDILSKVSSEKLKLIIQEILLYVIVFIVCVYHWIFLFISREKIGLNFCYINGQFDACSENQVCTDYANKMNMIVFNDTISLKEPTSYNLFNYFIGRRKTVNEYYKPFFAGYSEDLSRNKALSRLQVIHNSKGKINYVVALSAKEKWNLFYRNFNLCEARNYFIVFVVMVAIGGVLGSLFFGFLSDIFGRRNVIRSTLFIITITTLIFAGISFGLDEYTKRRYEEVDNSEEYKNSKLFSDYGDTLEIIKELYVQEKVRNFFKKIFFIFCFIIFILSAALWPLLKSCMALLIENAKGELNVLIAFRRYNFFFGGLPPFVTSLIFANLNNFTITFFILGFINLILFILSITFFEESIRYYYEYCEWPQLTDTVLKLYNTNIDEFKTLNDEELKKFRKEENIKNFNSSVKNNNYILNNDNNDSSLIYQNSYYNMFKEKNLALKRNIKRDTDFIIRLKDIRSNPLLIIICLISNRTFNNSKMLILIILILLYVTMNLLQKEFLQSPYFSMKDLFINSKNNILLNSVFFYLAITNILSNYFFYSLYRINCFKIIIMISLIFNIFALFIYHTYSYIERPTPIFFNHYNQKMAEKFNRDNISKYFLFLLFSIYFLLNGANFYVYLLILKISKTIYRCTYFSIHSIALIIAFVLTECIHLIMSHYFFFLAVLNILCLLTFVFLSEFKELLYVVNDLKIDIHRPSKNTFFKRKTD